MATVYDPGLSNHFLDNEDYRLYPRPPPQATSFTDANFLDLSDPSLCITPEKSIKRKSALIRDKASGSSSGSQKVRFDSTVEVKHLSPNTSTDTSNLSSTLTSQTDSSISSDKSQSDSSNSFSTVESDDVDFIDILASDVESHNAQLIYGKKRIHKTVVCTSVWGEDSSGENVLAKPEFNSTTMLQKHLSNLKVQELNVDDAVKHKLIKSQKVREKIAEKASTKLNRESNQYEELISVEMREEDVIAKAEKTITSKVKPLPKLQQTSSSMAPDIMEFFTPDLQRESLSLTLEGIASIQAVPTTANLDHTFNVYSHIRTWEGFQNG